MKKSLLLLAVVSLLEVFMSHLTHAVEHRGHGRKHKEKTEDEIETSGVEEGAEVAVTENEIEAAVKVTGKYKSLGGTIDLGINKFLLRLVNVISLHKALTFILHFQMKSFT